MAKNKSSFGEAASKGLRESYGSAPKPSSDLPSSTKQENIENVFPAEEPEYDAGGNSPQGVNPYYDYHPKTGKRGGTIGRPRAEEKRLQISFSCTEANKERFKRGAAADGRKLSDFINQAITEYIKNHNIDV